MAVTDNWTAELVDPATARVYASHLAFEPLDQAKVQRLAKAMSENRWEFDHQRPHSPLIFSWGALVEGHHRMAAVPRYDDRSHLFTSRVAPITGMLRRAYVSGPIPCNQYLKSCANQLLNSTSPVNTESRIRFFSVNQVGSSRANLYSVSWVVHPQPWVLEKELIDTLYLPLNLQDNKHNAFHADLTRRRAEAEKKARDLPVLHES